MNIEEIKPIKKDNPYFGEVYKTYIIHVFELFEIVNNSNLSEEEKKIEFNRQLAKYLSDNKKDMMNYLMVQTSSDRLISMAKDELQRGSESLNYDVVSSLYSTFINDVTIVSNDYEGKMYSTVINDQKIFAKPLLDETGNVSINLNIKYNFDLLKQTYDFAKKHGKQIKFHTFLWHDAIPENLKTEIDAISDPVVKRKMALTFLEHYAFSLASFMKENKYDLRQIEGLNEIASNGEDILRDSWWKDVIGNNPENGDDYFIDVLRIIRNAFPDTEIIYNEYGEYKSDKTDKIVSIIENIRAVEKRDGVVLLDGLGVQAHYSDYLKKENRALMPKDIYDSAIKIQKACGDKKIYVTEYDFIDFLKNGTKEELEKIFIDSYLRMANGFIIWGNSDSLTWYNCIDNNGKSRNAQIIDSKGIPKDIYYQYQKALYTNDYQNNNDFIR